MAESGKKVPGGLLAEHFTDACAVGKNKDMRFKVRQSVWLGFFSPATFKCCGADAGEIRGDILALFLILTEKFLVTFKLV